MSNVARTAMLVAAALSLNACQRHADRGSEDAAAADATANAEAEHEVKEMVSPVGTPTPTANADQAKETRKEATK